MRTSTPCGILVGLTVATAALAHASTAQAYGPIVADFNDSAALSRIYNQARNTFAFWSKPNGSGGYTYCTAANAPGCSLYSASGPSHVGDVFKANLRVESLAPYPHFHLGFEDPTIGACFSNDGFGRKVNGQCVAADWVHEPRTVSPHDNGAWVDIWVEGLQKTFRSGWQSTGPRSFDLMSFNNKGTVPVQLWVLWYDGYWYVWDDLGPGVHDLSGWAYAITRAQMGQPNSGSVITIDDVVVDHVVL